MSSIVEKKKKGRPSKADPGANDAPPVDIELRRSHRRRSVRYLFDLDDYFDDDGIFEDDEGQKRREKKLKQLLKVESKEAGGSGSAEPDAATAKPSRTISVQRASASSSSDCESPSKKRKIRKDVDDGNDYRNDGEGEVRCRKSEPKAKMLPTETATVAASSWLPLSHKKTLEFILDKLQKKDTYGAFAEPVDPEELPGYHDVIKKPMDFTTVRNKLSNGLYATLDEFESDVFLICANAMRFNAPDTVYYKQARTIQELAKKKFCEIRLNIHPSGKETKPEHKIRSGSSLAKKIMNSLGQRVQETFKPGFSIGTTHLAAVAIPQVSNECLVIGSERPSNINRLAESNSLLNVNSLDKGEETLPGKVFLARSGRKSIEVDENRRTTYDISLALLSASSESIFSTFEGETKELVPVGAYSDNSYARSLARYAATLGPVAWKVASKRIELALPQEVKYGQGWVGEFEPLPTPVGILENSNVKESAFFSNAHPSNDSGKHGKIPGISVSSNECPGPLPFSRKNLPIVSSSRMKPVSSPIASPVSAQQVREIVTGAEPSFFLAPGNRHSASSNLVNQLQNSQSKNFIGSEKRGLKQVELKGPFPCNKSAADSVDCLRMLKSSEIEVTRPICTSRNVNLSSSESVRKPDAEGVAIGGLPNGKVIGKKIDYNSLHSSSSDFVNGIFHHPQGQGQGLSNDPIQLMRMMTERAQDQQESANQSSVDAHQVLSAVSSKDSAAAAAARAWMSFGAGGSRPPGKNVIPLQNQTLADSLSNPTSEMHSHHNSFVPCAPQHTIGNSVQFPKQPMMFPPYANIGQPTYQLQSAWRNHNPQTHSNQKQESLPQSLSDGFQSSESPRNRTSVVLVDSQHPDLALQL